MDKWKALEKVLNNDHENILEKFWSDAEFVFHACHWNGHNFRFAHSLLKKDKKLVLKIIKYWGYSFEYADENFLRPIARFYEDILPANLRSGVTNFFSNLESINNALNSALQMKMGESVQELTRFCLNTTLGIGGFFDPASRLSINDSDEDFGERF